MYINKHLKAPEPDISKTALIVYLIIHSTVITIFFFMAQLQVYSNGTAVFGCVYSTLALCFLSYQSKNRIKNSVQKSITFILLSTMLGLVFGAIAYRTPLGQIVEKRQFEVFFEENKNLVGKDYLETYQMNKDNIEELRLLRQRIQEELNI